MSVGFVITPTSWEIVQPGLNPAIEVAFTSHAAPHWERLCEVESPEFVVVEATDDLLTADLVEEADRRGIVVAALITSPESDHIASARGVGHLIRQPIDLLELVSRSHSSRRRPLGNELSLVVAVWGATGAPGRTTVATAVATMLGGGGTSTVLLDADPRGGTVATSLGLLDEVPGFVALCRLAGRGELDSTQIERLASRYRFPHGEVDVLTGLARHLRDTDVPRDSVEQALVALRSNYEAIVIDLGSDLSTSDQPAAQESTPGAAFNAQLLEEADLVWAVIEASPVGVARFARAQSGFDEVRSGKPVRYLLNKVDAARRALGDEAVLSEALWRFTGVDEYWSIPHDFVSTQGARMAGDALVALGGKQPIIQALSGPVEELGALVQARNSRAPSGHDRSDRTQKDGSALMKKITNLIALR